MSFTPYISFNGNCEEAMSFYAEVFKSEPPSFMRWKDAPDGGPEGNEEKIMHANLMLGDFGLMAADAPPDHYSKPQGISIAHNVSRVEEGERIFNALAEGGMAMMPFGPSFFSKGFGMCMDKFGISWMVVVDGLPD